MKEQQAVIITGIGGGIGSALHDAFQVEGYKVIGLGRRTSLSKELSLYIPCDLEVLVSDEYLQAQLQDQVSQYLSENKLILKALINNAAYQVVKPFANLTTADFLSTHNINLLAPFVLTKLFHNLLEESQGRIINIGSVHSKLTKRGFCAYSTSKSALAGLTRSIALELAPRVTVNTISPAATETEMLKDGFKEHPEKYKLLENCHPMERIACPSEIAKLALFLCTPEADFITGSDIPVDGGISGRLHDPI